MATLTPIDYDPFATQGESFTGTLTPVDYDPFVTPKSPISDYGGKPERAGLIRPSSEEQRYQQNAEMLAKQKRDKQDAESIKRLQWALNNDLPLNPDAVAMFRDKLVIPENYSGFEKEGEQTPMQIQRGAAAEPVQWEPEPTPAMQITPGAVPLPITPAQDLERRRKQFAINSAQQEADMAELKAAIAPSIPELMLTEPSTSGDILRSAGSMASTVGNILPSAMRGVLDLPGVKQTIGETETGKAISEYADKLESNRAELGKEINKQAGGGTAGKLANMGQQSADMAISTLATVGLLNATGVFAGGMGKAEHLKSAAKMAAMGYIQTPGSQSDKLKAAALMATYALSPIPASKMPKDWQAKIVNAIENLAASQGLALMSGEEIPWNERIPQIVIDAAFGASAVGRGTTAKMEALRNKMAKPTRGGVTLEPIKEELAIEEAPAKPTEGVNPNAVQEPSPAKVDVLPAPADGGKVGEGNAVREVAETRKPVEPPPQGKVAEVAPVTEDAPELMTPESKKGTWRKAVANTPDEFRKAQILRAIVEGSKSESELTDVLIETEKLSITDTNLLYDIMRNKNASEATRARAKELYDLAFLSRDERITRKLPIDVELAESDTIPEGYVHEGDRYVFKGEPPPPAKPPAGETQAVKPAEKLSKKIRSNKWAASQKKAQLLGTDYTILNLIDDMGGMRPFKSGELKEELSAARGKRLVSNKGLSSPDEIATEAFNAGLIKEPSVDALVEHIKNRTTLKNAQAEEKARTEMADDQQAQHEKWLEAQRKLSRNKAKGEEVQSVTMSVGNTFAVDNERFKVVAEDADGFKVQDGTTFWIPYKRPVKDERVFIDKGSYKPSEGPTLTTTTQQALIPEEKMPFNLTGGKAPVAEPAKPVPKETIQTELFEIQKVVQDVDPVKSANFAEQTYGGATEAVRKLKRQLSVVDSDPAQKKNFPKEARLRLAEVIKVLEQRSSKPTGSERVAEKMSEVAATVQLTVDDRLKIANSIAEELANGQYKNVNLGIDVARSKASDVANSYTGPDGKFHALARKSIENALKSEAVKPRQKTTPIEDVEPTLSAKEDTLPSRIKDAKELAAKIPTLTKQEQDVIDTMARGETPKMKPQRLSQIMASIRKKSEKHQREQAAMMIGPGTPSTENPEIITGTALNRATAEFERASRGMRPADKTVHKEQVIEWIRSEKRISDDPELPRRIMDEAMSGKSISDADAAVLLRHKVSLENKVNTAAEKTNTAKTDAERGRAQADFDSSLLELENLMDAAQSGLTTWGRTGRWAQMIADEDYTLGNMLKRAKAKKGGKELEGAEKLKIQMLQKELEAKQKEIEWAGRKINEVSEQLGIEKAKAALDQLVKDQLAKEFTSTTKVLDKVVKYFDEAGDAAMARIRARQKEGRMYSGVPDPVELADYTLIGAKHIARGIRDFTAWQKRMISDFGEYLKPYLRSIYDNAMSRVKTQNDVESKKPKGVKNPAAEGKKTIKDLFREQVEAGLKDLDPIVKNVRDILAKDNPDITEREVRDQFSDYGKSSMPSQEPFDVTMRDLRAQSQKVSQLEDVMSGKPPSKTGMGRDAPSIKVRELTKQVHSEMKKAGIETRDPDIQLKSSLDAIKTRLSNSIEELNKAIATRIKLVVNKPGVAYDAEANVLKAKRDVLQKQYDEMFPKEPITEEERYDRALKSAQHSLDVWERKLDDAKKGIFQPDIKKGVSQTKEMMDIRKQREAAKAEFEALRDAAMPDRKDKIKLQMYSKGLDRRINELQAKIKSGVLPEKKTKTELTLDDATTQKKFEFEKVKERWLEMQYDLQLANRTKWQMVGQGVEEVGNTMRSLKASFDIGHLRRQGGLHFLSHPIESIGLLPETLRAMRSEKEAFRINRKIKDDPIYQEEKKAKLFIHTENTGLNAMEDAFRGRWWKNIPGLKAFGRAYTSGLNLVRDTIFKRFRDQLIDVGKWDADAANTTANFINNWTGRGQLWKLEQSARGLANIFFSARLATSRFTVITAPLTGFRSYGKSVAARKIIAKEYARYLAGVATYWGVIAGGASAFLGTKGDKWDIEFDPRSSNFGKVRVGNTTIDPLSGLQQPLVLLIKTISGQEKNQKGKIVPLYGHDQAFNRDIEKIWNNFLRSKLSPGASFVKEVVTRKNYRGYPITAKELATETLTPMLIMDTYQAINDIYNTFGSAGIPAGVILGLMSAVGEGIQTWDQETKAERKEKKHREFLD